MLRQTPRRALYLLIAGLALFFFFLSSLATTTGRSGTRSKGSSAHRPAVTPPIARAGHHKLKPHIPPRLEVELIVATTSRDNTTWLTDKLKGWTKNVYVVDDPSAALTVPKNKGHEAMAYLTCAPPPPVPSEYKSLTCWPSYIIDRYDNLPPTMVFHHAERFQWHNDDPDYDALVPLQNLQLDYVQEVGYTNLRCSWAMGCPVEIRPKATNQKFLDGEVPTAQAYPKAFRALLPGAILPDEVGANCCSQFAVSRKVVKERKKEEYERMRDWLIETDLTDDLTGRIFEYTWHSKLSFGHAALTLKACR